MSGQRKYMAANDAAAQKNGSGKHWTKAERELRVLTEVKPKAEKKVMAPKWLTNKTHRAEFYELAKLLKDMDVGFCQPDADFLAIYILTRTEYLAASNHVRKAVASGDSKEAKAWASTRDKMFSECRACANELGLTISSRCKLVAPEPEEQTVDPLAELRKKYMEA